MANTKTNTQVVVSKARVIQYLTLSSDASQETDYVVYDSSAVATTLGRTDPLKCRILSVRAYLSASAPTLGATTGAQCILECDATTDVLAFTIPANTHVKFNASCYGGLPWLGATGSTGDLLLTTTGLEAGDTLTLVLEVYPG